MDFAVLLSVRLALAVSLSRTYNGYATVANVGVPVRFARFPLALHVFLSGVLTIPVFATLCVAMAPVHHIRAWVSEILVHTAVYNSARPV